MPETNKNPYLEKAADELIVKAKIAEPQITQDMKEIEEKTRCELVGLYEKIIDKNDLMQVIDIKQTMLIQNVLSYTIVTNAERYVKTYKEVYKILYSKGYLQTEWINYWNDTSAFKGIITKFVTPDNYVFEIQFHTLGSLELNKELIPMHKKLREAFNLDSQEYAKLKNEMMSLSNNVKIPANLDKLT